MTAPRKQMFVVAAALAAVSCSDSGGPSTSASSAAKAPSTTASAPSPRPTSAFCLNLSTIQVAVLAYRGEVGGVIGGQEPDLKELRRKAGLVAAYSKETRASAPPDIAKQYETVLDAVAASARKLKPGNSVRDVADPVYGKRNRAAFDAVQNYECR